MEASWVKQLRPEGPGEQWWPAGPEEQIRPVRPAIPEEQLRLAGPREQILATCCSLKFMATFGNTWEIIATGMHFFGKSWQFEDLWKLLGQFLRSFGSFGSVWILMATYGNLWQFFANFMSLFLFLFGNFGLLIATIDNF